MNVSYGKRDDDSLWLSIGDPVTGPHIQADWEFGEKYLRLFVDAILRPAESPSTDTVDLQEESL